MPLRIELTVTDTAGAPMPGAALYLWHCDRDGRYSLYDVEDQNYLRGVQQADTAGKVAFTSIFPAAYAGRWPHVHFEVYPDLAAATSSDNAITTSQLALPQDVCEQVYATDGYERAWATWPTSRWPPTTCSATAPTRSWPPSPEPSLPGSSPR